MNKVRKWFDKTLAILRDNAWTGIGVLIVIAGLIGGYFFGVLQWLIAQFPVVLDFLSTPVTIKFWVLIAFAIPLIISVFSLGQKIYHRRQAMTQVNDYVGSSDDETDLSSGYELVHGVLWMWPISPSAVENTLPRCPVHGVTMDIVKKTEGDAGSGVLRKYTFECRGPENGRPHVKDGPEYDFTYDGSLRGDVYDRLRGQVARTGG